MTDNPAPPPTTASSSATRVERPQVAGPVLAAGLGTTAIGALGAACLGWAGIPILIALMASGATLLVRWSR